MRKEPLFPMPATLYWGLLACSVVSTVAMGVQLVKWQNSPACWKVQKSAYKSEEAYLNAKKEADRECQASRPWFLR